MIMIIDYRVFNCEVNISYIAEYLKKQGRNREGTSFHIYRNSHE